MKRFATAIGVLGAFNATLWAWVPSIVRWQAQNTLERYGPSDARSVEVLVQVFLESAKYQLIEAAIIGTLTTLASTLILFHRIAGWYLWHILLTICIVDLLVTVVCNGFSFGTVLRTIWLATFAYSTKRVHDSYVWIDWFTR